MLRTSLHSQVLDVTLPAGSHGSPPDDGIEVWDVPLPMKDEIADLERQLPVNAPLDGLKYCGDAPNGKTGIWQKQN